MTPAPGSVGTVTCDFEPASICGYQQDKTDNFDWTYSQGRTSTLGTGPANDHTLNSYYGKDNVYLGFQMILKESIRKHILGPVHIHLDVIARVTNQIPTIYPIISTQSSIENYAKMRHSLTFG